MQLKSRLVPCHVNINWILEWNVAGQEGRVPELQQVFFTSLQKAGLSPSLFNLVITGSSEWIWKCLSLLAIHVTCWLRAAETSKPEQSGTEVGHWLCSSHHWIWFSWRLLTPSVCKNCFVTPVRCWCPGEVVYLVLRGACDQLHTLILWDSSASIL